MMIPDSSPVTDERYWHTAGVLLALVLLAGEDPHPVSPVVIYTLLASVHTPPNSMLATMDLSLGLIRELDEPKVATLLPWMIIPEGQDWKSLPTGHHVLLRDTITFLGLDVSRISLIVLMGGVILSFKSSWVSTRSLEDHIRWTTVIVTTAMLGSSSFFSNPQFQGMAQSFGKCIKKEDEWSEVSFHPVLRNVQQLKRWESRTAMISAPLHP